MSGRKTPHLSAYLCPACRNRLCVDKGQTYAVVIFCARGQCPSYAANDGEEADFETEAFEKLKRSIEEEGEL